MIKKRQLLTIDEAANLLNVSKTSLRRWTNDGRLRCHRVGGRRERRFALEDLNAFLNDGAAMSSTTASGDPVAFLNAIASAGTPRHVCLHFQNADEQWRLFSPYLLSHLRAEAPVHFHYDSENGTTREGLFKRLRQEGENPDALMEKGLLNLTTSSGAALENRGFSADRNIDFVESLILGERAAGFERVLLSAEMSWCFSGAVGMDEIISYEERLNGVLEKYPEATVVCQYNMKLLDATVNLGALCSHPIVQLPDRIAKGFYVS